MKHMSFTACDLGRAAEMFDMMLRDPEPPARASWTWISWKYAIQIKVADPRDGACPRSTLREASSWGKVDTTYEQTVFAEATSVLPLLASDASPTP